MADIGTVATVAGLVNTAFTLERQLRERIEAANNTRVSQFSTVQRVPAPTLAKLREYTRSRPAPFVGRNFGTEIF